LDRDNLKAQRDKCGLGLLDDEWRFAVDQKFNVTHWPYIHSDETYFCVQKFFSDSYFNMYIEGAFRLVSTASAAIVLITLL
jgi:hypothetical protein